MSIATERVDEGLIEDLPLQVGWCVAGCVYSGHWMVDGVGGVSWAGMVSVTGAR